MEQVAERDIGAPSEQRTVYYKQVQLWFVFVPAQWNSAFKSIFIQTRNIPKVSFNCELNVLIFNEFLSEHYEV